MKRLVSGSPYLIRLAIVCFLLISAASCAPKMIEVEGHRVFNPAYLWFLESKQRDKWQKPDQVLEALEVFE